MEDFIDTYKKAGRYVGPVKFKEWDCHMVQDKYSNGRPALLLLEEGTGETIAMASVNLPEHDVKDNEIFIKDYSENEGMMGALVDANLVTPTGRIEHSGYVTIPSAILKVEAIDE